MKGLSKEEVLEHFTPRVIACLIEERNLHRKNGEFDKADFTRDALLLVGIKLVDYRHKTVPEWIRGGTLATITEEVKE